MLVDPFSANFVFPENKGCWQLLFPNWNTMMQKDLVVPAMKTRFPCLAKSAYCMGHNITSQIMNSMKTVLVDLLLELKSSPLLRTC